MNRSPAAPATAPARRGGSGLPPGLLPRRLPPWAVFACGILVAPLFAAAVAAAQRAPRGPAATSGGHPGALWASTAPLDDGRQMLLVVDQEQRALAIYHVDPATGTVALKSSRDISWDLLVGDFNAQEPKPASLRRMLEMQK
jgi:hypothetical protein